jgi:hypothetical protein
MRGREGQPLARSCLLLAGDFRETGPWSPWLPLLQVEEIKKRGWHPEKGEERIQLSVRHLNQVQEKEKRGPYNDCPFKETKIETM